MRAVIQGTVACCLIGFVGIAGAASPDVLGWWTFDQTDAALGGPAEPPPTGENYTRETPGKFIYDPLTERSRANLSARAFGDAGRGGLVLPWKGKLGEESLTLEAFIRPLPEAHGDAWLVGKSAAGDKGAELAVEWFHIRNHGVTFHGGSVQPAGERANRFAAGHYSSSSRLTKENRNWRHAAVVYDAETKAVTCWIDYHLTHQVRLKTPLAWDDGPLRIGGRDDGAALKAIVDEIRLTRGALQPAQFLRARADAIEDVSFVSEQTIAPRDAGCLDMKENFGAAGDGRTDDTAAFNTAFEHLASKVPLAYHTLLIPPGEYRLTGTLHCSRFIDVKGAGPERTVLRLADVTFTDPDNPQPVLRMSSTSGPPGSNRGVNGSSISIYLDGVTIDTGRGNPGAKALEYHSNNVGRLENVVLRSGDGAGAIGLDLLHHDVGPALVKRVVIEGFDLGVAIRYQEYSHTFEDLTLRKQRVAGLRNQGNIVAIRRLRSENRVPAVVCEGANSMAVLLDSELRGGADDQPAIRAAGGLYALRVKTDGYRVALVKEIFDPAIKQSQTQEVAGPQLAEYIGDRLTAGFGNPTGALKLQILDTPEPELPPVGEWINAANFADRKQGADWSPVLQAAIDSGARVVYLPRDIPGEFRTPIRIHAPLERLIGYGGELQWSREGRRDPPQAEQTDASAAPPPLLIYDEPNPEHVLVLDRLGCRHVQHASAATLVLRSSSPGRYSTAVAGGKLFAEDVGGADWHFDHPQSIWVRQWNPESHAAGPCIHLRGGTLWALGFKTEYESQKLLAEGGAKTEILGAFIYPLGKIPPDRPIFENRDSALSLVYGTSVYHANHKVHIRDLRGKERREIGNDALLWAGSRARMDLYSSGH